MRGSLRIGDFILDQFPERVLTPTLPLMRDEIGHSVGGIGAGCPSNSVIS